MKICYCDESGIGDEPVAVMAGVVVDSQRMHVTKEHWEQLLSDLSEIVKRKVTEFHTREFYPGRGVWSDLDGESRSEVITAIAQWLNDRKHHVVFSAVNKVELQKSIEAGKIPKEVRTVWRFIGLHLVLSVQREFQKHEKTKGHTIFIFDNEKQEEMIFSDLIKNPPNWSDTYYSRTKKDDSLSHIVDVPYFADSRHVALIQVADFLAFFMRRFIEIADGHTNEKYDGEFKKLESWVKLISSRVITTSSIYPSRGRCECAEMFHSHAPRAAHLIAK
jgi:hypothetical protein